MPCNATTGFGFNFYLAVVLFILGIIIINKPNVGLDQGMRYGVAVIFKNDFVANVCNNNKTFVEIEGAVEKFWKYRRVAGNGPERP